MKQKYRSEQVCQDITSAVISLYLFIMMGFFPLYYKYQYADMGDAKYKIFLYASISCVVVFFLCYIVKKVVLTDKQLTAKAKNAKNNSKKNRIALDTAVILYFLVTTLSFLCSPFKETGFWGSDGWNMGFLAQFLFIVIYFMIAKWWKYEKWVLWLLIVSSAIVFFAAVLHRFDVDMLNIYGDLDQYYKVLFLSTMGQSSWYSSFLCTVFPVGLFIFYSSEDKKVRIISGVYSVIAMCSLVTQNTDSAFLSLAAVLIVLFYLGFDKNAEQTRFLEVLMVILGSFCFMGLCQKLFVNRAIPLDSLSLFMSQSKVIWIALIFVIACYLLMKKKRITVLLKSRMWFWGILGIIGAGILVTIVFIVVNTNGLLLEKIGFQSTNNYLLFQDEWGNGRGFAWKFAVSSFGDFPFFRKLIGVGPDCFSAYIKSVPEYLDAMQAFWGDLVLTNAHNEYLTKLYNVGIAGVVSYVGMLLTAIWTFCKHRGENSLLPAFALCTVSYMTHNIFCYEQVCCSPFFYILMGIGSNLIHNRIVKRAY